jgi:adenosyl cobinamide kinase/adenosyl cobinamide phosphate guanylyltransferase
VRGWRRALILGGIRSGKSELAEELVSSASAVTYIATARRDPADAEWEARIAAHRRRRPAAWSTAEVADDPQVLPELIMAASGDQALLVDDLGTWLAGLMDAHDDITGSPAPADPAVRAALATAGGGLESPVARLVAAVERTPARLVLVSPEVGLSVVPATESGRAFADALGAANRAVAAACDVVALVIAGNAVPVKGAL